MKPRLLVLSPWFPYPPDNGSRLRAFHLLRVLAKAFEIRLVAGVQDDSPPDVPAPLDALCQAVIPVPWVWHDGGRATGGAGAIRALLSPVPRSLLETPNAPLTQTIAAETARKPDAVLVMQIGMDAYLPPEILVPVVLDEVEVSGMERAVREATGVAARLKHGLTQAKGSRYWAKRLRRYKAVTAVSGAEAEAVGRLWGKSNGGPPVVVIPNGVETKAYSGREAGKIVPGRLLYNGAITYGPNRDAVAWFVREMLPRIAAQVPDAHLWVTGRHPAEDAKVFAGNPRILLTGFLPDLRPVLAESEVCVVPLRAGGGTRLKILEAWAARLPVVSTTIGAAGLDGVDGTHFLLRDAPDTFAEAVIALLRNPAQAKGLAENAHHLAESRYDWETIGGELTALLTRVINSPSSTQAT